MDQSRSVLLFRLAKAMKCGGVVVGKMYAHSLNHVKPDKWKATKVFGGAAGNQFKDFQGFSRISTDFQGFSRPGILFTRFKDFPGFARTVLSIIPPGLAKHSLESLVLKETS